MKHRIHKKRYFDCSHFISTHMCIDSAVTTSKGRPGIAFCSLNHPSYYTIKLFLYTRLRQGCGGYGNSHGNSHGYGYGMGMGTVLNSHGFCGNSVRIFG